jgi:exodeoxyribonuclease VII small subunit
MAARRRAAASAQAGSSSPTGEEEPTFEQALERLEEIVNQLEGGDLELEAALEAFEQGVALTRRCAGQLDAAERHIEQLVQEGERWLVRPFDEGEETG